MYRTCQGTIPVIINWQTEQSISSDLRHFFFFFFKWPCFSKSTFQSTNHLPEQIFGWDLFQPITHTIMQMMAAHRTKDRARDDGWKKISQTTFMDFSFSLAWFTVWRRFFKLMMKSTDKERRLFLHIEFRTHLNSVVLVKTGNMKCHRKKKKKPALNRLISCHKLSRVGC